MSVFCKNCLNYKLGGKCAAHPIYHDYVTSLCDYEDCGKHNPNGVCEQYASTTIATISLMFLILFAFVTLGLIISYF